MKKYCIVAVVFFSTVLGISSDSLFAAALKLGSSGDEVVLLQARLIEFGYLEGSPDGKYGGNTHDAVASFQLDYGLEPDGIAGEQTQKALLMVRVPEQASPSRGIVDTRKGQQLVSFAKRFLGVPYVWAGGSPGGFDCSGYIYYIYSQYGIALPRMADDQFEAGQPVSRSDLVTGDLVFFSTYEPGPSHVGIYIGSGQFIHASSGADQVTITPLNKPYYKERYIGARRVIK